MDINDMKAEINLMENAIYVVKSGELTKVESPPKGFGQHTFHWENRKVERIVHNHIQKI